MKTLTTQHLLMRISQLGCSGWEIFIRISSGPTLFLLYINDLPDDVICNIAIYAADTTSTPSVIRHLICGNN